MANNAQPNRFQFILNIRGIITEVLANAPDGWLNTAIKYTRSKTYQGLFRGETLPTKYVTRAAYLLRNEFYKYGVLGFVKVVINLLNPATWAYNQIYAGRLDFSTVQDELASFTVTSITDDFTYKLNANDGVNYMIPIDVDVNGNPIPDAVNIELTPLTLRESATFVPGAPTDGNRHSDYFPPMDLASGQQNSVNVSTKAVQYGQLRNPDFSTSADWFFQSRVNGKLKITGNLNFTIFDGGGGHHLQLAIFREDGSIVYTFYDGMPSSETIQNISINTVLTVSLNERLFLYMRQIDPETSNTGITINGGTLQLDYNTISPATMCRAVPASYVFSQLLQAMNTNTDSAPNQPVPWKSDLLTSGFLSELMITCSDSIRNSVGSIVNAGETVFPGFYKVIAGTIVYGGQTFTLSQTFSYQPGVLTFTGGSAQKTISGFVGTVYNPGDTLQAGGTYLVGGNPGTHIVYNAISYNVGQTFKYILGQNTFTGSDDSSFVEQVGIATQLITNFKDFFQSIYSIQGGNCSFGIETIAGVSTCFMENLAYVYRGSIGNLDAGKVDTAIKITPATDMIPNSIKVGYRDQQYSTLNGYYEVNSEQTYITGIVQPKKELNLLSAYRADPYGIEEIRVSQNDTAASRSNNDVFMIYKLATSQTVGDVTYYKPLTTEALATNPVTGQPMITGVDTSYYNWSISPKQNLLRGAPYLASLFYNMGGYSLTLSAAPKNTAMVTVDSPFHRRVAEAEPILISTLGLPLFLPFYATFKPGIEQGGLQMIDSIPYGFIKFTYNQQQYKMFADEISVDIGQNSQQEFKGLLTPGNDLTTLIH